MPSLWPLLKPYKGQMAILVILTAAGNALNLPPKSQERTFAQATHMARPGGRANTLPFFQKAVTRRRCTRLARSRGRGHDGGQPVMAHDSHDAGRIGGARTLHGLGDVAEILRADIGRVDDQDAGGTVEWIAKAVNDALRCIAAVAGVQVADDAVAHRAQRAFEAIDHFFVVMAVRRRRFGARRHGQLEHAGRAVGGTVAQVADLQRAYGDDVVLIVGHGASFQRMTRSAACMRGTNDGKATLLDLVKPLYRTVKRLA